MRHALRFMFLLLLMMTLTAFATSATAQTITTGSIEGNVLDPNGAAVPGITVTATGPQTLVPRSGTTDDNGHYRISALSPGAYTVTIEAQKGFAKFERGDVPVNLDKTTSADIKLELATTQVNVTVTATAGAALDVTTNTTGSNVSTEQFSNFPTQRTVQSLYSIAPTVARSGLVDASGRDRDPSVAGSSGPENNYILDGVNHRPGIWRFGREPAVRVRTGSSNQDRRLRRRKWSLNRWCFQRYYQRWY